MSGKKLRSVGKEPSQLVGKNARKRKLSTKIECSELEENKDHIVSRKKRLSSPNAEKRDEDNVEVSKYGNRKSNCELTRIKSKKKSASKHSQNTSVIEIKENVSEKLNDVAVSSVEKLSNVIESKMQEGKISKGCDESGERKTNHLDFETLIFMKYESFSSKKGVPVNTTVKNLSNESIASDKDCFKSPKTDPNLCLEKYDLTKDSNSSSSSLLAEKKKSKVKFKNDMCFQSFSKKAVKNGLKSTKKVINNKKKSGIKNNANQDPNFSKADQNLTNLPQVTLANKKKTGLSLPSNNGTKSKKSISQQKTKNLKPRYKSPCKVSSDESEELVSDTESKRSTPQQTKTSKPRYKSPYKVSSDESEELFSDTESKKSTPQRKAKKLKSHYKSLCKVSSDESEELYSEDKIDVDYIPFLSNREPESISKLVVRKNPEVRKRRKKSDLDKSSFQIINQSESKKYITELAKNTNELLVELLHFARIVMLKDNRTKLNSSDVLQAQNLLLKKPLISEPTYSQNDLNILDLNVLELMQSERYEVLRPSFQDSNTLEIRNFDFVQLPQALQDYFVAITRAIFYKDKYLFKFAVRDMKKNTCMSVLSPFFYELAVHVIKKFFPNMFYLERIYDVIISLIENNSAFDSKEHYLKKIIFLLLDYVLCSPSSVVHENDLWSYADSTANLFARIFRKNDMFLKEMCNSILLHLEKVFQDTSKEFYHYYGALAIIIPFGPLAAFQVISKNFLPLYNHLNKYINNESSVQKEALLVYGHLRSAIELLIRHCLKCSSLKFIYSSQLESLSPSKDNSAFHEETEKILDFLLSNNMLQNFGETLSSRLPILTDCFVNQVPLSDFALQLEKDFQISEASSKDAKSKLSRIEFEKFSSTKSKALSSGFDFIKRDKKMKDNKSKSKPFLSCKRVILKKKLDYLKSSTGNLHLFL